ncbi:DUF58 domain-containing protein [Paenibacillus ginsengarvi]|uniref:DUF58 domain-containing protein n=1 Tax=Paenibacillus ginsengarvi TaxID=400777 RepID=A0A3B0CTA6_9BACL|nr:DUF58 domain-containing protein [Paenibacillus ginsengarvi]RKN86931.1 DUF58 domain-containing protein [Paenibacillus ginsengarvi]
MSAEPLLLDSETLLRLEQLTLAVKTRIRGSMQGKRKSRQKGASLDFSDYRLYAPGDDIRQIDWNAYGRSGKPFVKLFHDEREQHVRLWIDASGSMHTGGSGGAVDGGSKLLHAKKLAACIGYMALAGYDRVSAGTFSERVTASLPAMRGKASAQRLFRFLAEAGTETGQTAGDIGKALAEPGALPRQPGMTWIFSDFLFESGIRETLQMLLAARQEVVVVQVLSSDELDPFFSGDLRLVDVETGAGKEVAMSGKVVKAYKEALHAYTHSLRGFCHERGIAYGLAPTNVPALEWIGTTMRGMGVLQ